MKKIILVLLCGLLLVSFTACSALPSQSAPAMTDEYPKEEPASYGEYASEASAFPQEESAEAVMDGEVESGTGLGMDTANIPDTNRKLVYHANFTIHSRNFVEDYNAILNKLKESQGYVESETTNSTVPDAVSYSGRSSSLSVRVPVDNFETFFTGVAGIGNVVEQSRSTDDITGNYYDTESRIKLLEAERDRLLGYLQSATKPEDIIAYEKRLSEVLYDLDQLQGQKRSMDDLVDYTSLSIELYEIVEAGSVPIDENGLPLDERANDAFTKSMSGVGKFMEDFAVGFAAAAPVLILLAVIAVIVLVIIKLIKVLRKKAGKNTDKKQSTPMGQPPYQNTPPTPPYMESQPPKGSGQSSQNTGVKPPQPPQSKQ